LRHSFSVSCTQRVQLVFGLFLLCHFIFLHHILTVLDRQRYFSMFCLIPLKIFFCFCESSNALANLRSRFHFCTFRGFFHRT
jgi:hypothetical protein